MKELCLLPVQAPHLSLNATSLSAGSEASSRPYSSSLYSQSQRSSSDLSSSEAKDSYSEDSTISSYNTTSESSFQTSASHANDEDTTFEMASYGSSSSGSSSESGKTYEKNYENQSGYIKPKKPVNKKLVAGLACAIAAIGIGGGVGGWLYSTRDVRAARKAERLALEQQRQEKENTIALIQTYSSQGLYDNSLSLINGLLLKDNQDTDGNSLFNTTAQLKKDSENALKAMANAVKSAKDAAGSDEAKKAISETALKVTNGVKEVNGAIVSMGKYCVRTINAYLKELKGIVKQLKPKEKPADNAGGDASDKSGGDKNATAMFAFL